ILQETYLEAARRLPEYLKEHKMPFYLWLWWIARDKIIAAHRFHMVADKRSVDREVASLPLDSSAQLVRGLLSKGPTPSREFRRTELAEGLKGVFDKLDSKDREIIMLRHFEQLSSEEVSSLLKIGKAAANKRYLRALDHLRKLLGNLGISNSSSMHGRDTAFKIAEEIKEDHDAPSL
ncbi:MAG: sigma-70 family RNA polymerase sigma factor, partial [Planctomycetota bacterium]